ncbi:MAG TPA: hypothetical protein VMS93_08775, partial [Candidatus Saccharimonadales bacterium]|nr:hypothetical protein [Candidatus Saccharimonadales bacterium]
MKPVRPLLSALAALALLALCSALAAAAPPTPVGNAPRDSGIVTPPIPLPLPYTTGIRLDPAAPCLGKPAALLLDGEFPDACGRVVSAQVIDPNHVALTLDIHPPAVVCAMVPTAWHQRFDLGVLPAGGGSVEVAMTVRDSPNAGTYQKAVPYVVVPCDSTFPPALGPYVERLYTDPAVPCAGRPVNVVVEGEFPDACGRVLPDSGDLSLRITVLPPPGGACALVVTPWRKVFPMGVMAAGNYQVSIQEQVLDGPHQGTYALALGWQTVPCDSQPPGVAFLEHVFIGWPVQTVPDVGRICPNDSFPVALSGHLPDGCWSLDHIDVAP